MSLLAFSAVERNNDGAQRNAGEFLRRCSKEINFV